jgi:hypothetical protein
VSRAAALLAAALLAGCAQVLGLDSTDRRDAEGPPLPDGGVCSAELACAAGAERAVCGRLVDAVTQQPLVAPGATGAACVQSADGPCAFAVAGLSADELFTGTGAPIAGTVDDCGRYRVEGVAGERLAVTATPIAPADAVYRRSASTVLYNAAGNVDGLEVPIVPIATIAGWEAEAALAIPEALLVKFRLGTTPSAGFVAKIDTVPVALPPTPPFAVYFHGANPFETIVDPGAGALRADSGETGTAALVPASTAAFSLGGAKPGKNCTEVAGIQLVPALLVYVELMNC